MRVSVKVPSRRFVRISPKLSSNGVGKLSATYKVTSPIFSLPPWKNELSYNPNTWVEWVNNAFVIGDLTGLEFTLNSTTASASYINTNLKPNTKYGLLINIPVNTSVTRRLVLDNYLTGAYPNIASPGQLGNIKNIITTQAVITTNRLRIAADVLGDNGLKIKLKDIRIFELPPGSEIESDFNTMTADQLNTKYPFYPNQKTGKMNLTLYGLTATNLFGTDGNFGSDGNADGLGDGWIQSLVTSLSISGNIQSFTPTAQYSKLLKTAEIRNQNINDKIYYRALVKSTSNLTRLQLNEGTGGIYQSKSHSGSGNFELLSVIGTLKSKTDSSVYVDTNATSGWTPIQVQKAMLINLTQVFGVGNEPTQAWCDANLNYFDNTQNAGNKVTNLFGTDGNFGSDSNADGLTDGWVSNGVVSAMSISNNVQSFTPTAQYGNIGKTVEIRNQNVNDKIYFRALVKSNLNTTQLVINEGTGTTFPSKSHSGSGNFELLSMIGILKDKTTSKIYIQNVSASGWTPIQIKQAMFINLTQLFGAGNEPSATICDQMFADYFDNTKNMIRVRSVGKNLLRLNSSEWEQGNINGGDGSLFYTNNRIRMASGVFIRVSPSTLYSMSISSNYNITLSYYDINKNWINQIGAWYSSVSFTTPSNAYYIRIIIKLSNDGVILPSEVSNTQGMIALGSTATPYEPYTQTYADLPSTVTLNSVGTTKDDLNIYTDGSYVWNKKNNEKVLQASDVWGVDTTQPNADYALISKPSDSLSKGDNTKYGVITIEGYTDATVNYYNNVNSVGQSSTLINSNNITIGFSKGSLGSDDTTKLANAKIALANKKLTYALKAPIQYAGTGLNLDAYKNGTVIVEDSLGNPLAVNPSSISVQYEVSQ